MSDLYALTIERRKLLALQIQVDQQLAAVEAAIRVRGVLIGRPRRPYRYTIDEAREMHRRYNAGDRSHRVREGEREYKRRVARAARERARRTT